MTQQISSHVSRRAILMGSAAIALAGCGSLIGPTGTPRQIYLLKPVGGASSTGPSVNWQLSVLTPTATEHLDSDRIALTQSDTSVDYFADSGWTDHLPVLVQNALVEAFENSGRIQAVAADSQGFHADYILQTDLRDFEARYSQPDGIPIVMVRMEAKLAPNLGRGIIASLNSVHEVQAAQNSVPAVVRAFDDALGQVLSEIINWALAVPASKPR